MAKRVSATRQKRYNSNRRRSPCAKKTNRSCKLMSRCLWTKGTRHYCRRGKKSRTASRSLSSARRKFQKWNKTPSK